MQVSPERSTDVLNFLAHGMDINSRKLTSATLGNRSEYVGMSDLAKYSECPRAALSAKLLPSDASFNRKLIFARGHWIEAGIGDCLASCGYPIMQQLEICEESNGVPIKAHLDFVLFTNTPEPKVRIVEVKSMSAIPDAPYPQHEFQANGQVSLLYEFWNKPVFTLRDENGCAAFENATFPAICNGNFGVSMPESPDDVSLEAWLLCVSMKDAKPFGPYTFSQDSISDVIILAEEFWGYYSQLREDPEALLLAPYMNDYNPFCCVCQYNGDCPKFCDGDQQPQWEAAIQKWEHLKEQKAACEAELKELDAAIRQAY